MWYSWIKCLGVNCVFETNSLMDLMMEEQVETPTEANPKDRLRRKRMSALKRHFGTSANKLRGTVESSEYKHVVLGLIFLKFAATNSKKRRVELIAEGKQAYLDMSEFYTMKNVFYLPEISRWST